jgi:hypothetical protein
MSAVGFVFTTEQVKIQGDSKGKVNIFGCDSLGLCVRKMFILICG